MYCGRDFSPQERTESEVFGLDFVNDLEPNEILTTSIWTIAVVAGVDINANDRLEGPPKVVAPTGSSLNTSSIQRIGGLLPGTTYRVKAVAITSDGNTKTLWSHIRGISDDI